MAAEGLNLANLTPFEDVAAGHDGVLSDASGDLVIKPCTAGEVSFYEECAQHPIFRAVIPTYMGTLFLSSEIEKAALENAAALQSSGVAMEITSGVGANILRGPRLDTKQAIVLENVAGGFERPNVLDVKLGIRLWGDEAPPAKRNKFDLISSETTSGSLGLRIAGMRVWQAGEGESGGEYKIYDKIYGRQFSDQNIRQGFEDYFYVKTGEGAGARKELTASRREVLRRLTNEVGNIQEVLESEESRMYSSSILFAYEGDVEVLDALLAEEANPQAQKRGDDQQITTGDGGDDSQGHGGFFEVDSDEEEEEGLRVCSASLIDFAHAAFTPGQGPDENALRGVRNVRAILESMLISP